MELLIRQQLSDAERKEDIEALKKSYKLIKSADEGKSILDSSESFCSDLYVLCAEQAYKMDFPEISRDCLQMYFNVKPPANQFFSRAYLCQSQLYTPVSTDNLEQFEKFTGNLLKAIDFALLDSRHYFLIYNASIIYWKIVRPFFKPGFLHFLIPSLSQIVPALSHPTEQDVDWTADLMVELLECFLDASRIEEAKDFASTAAEFIKENAPKKYKTLFSLMVRNKLMDESQIQEELEHNPSLQIIYNLQRIKLRLDANDVPQDPSTELARIYGLLKTRKLKVTHNEKISLLLELARLSLRLNCISVAASCITDLKSYKIQDPGREIELDCLECDYEVQKLGPKITTYAKSVVEAQLKVIQKLELILNRAIRLKDPNVIQAVCTTQWNLCLPLLQDNLQHYVRKPLLAIAEILEKIDSMLILLRCQVHMEIARIEEKGERIEPAIEHFKKALCLDNNGQYHEYLRMAFHRLSVNTMLYEPMERLEDQASLMIEQAKKGTTKDSVRKKRSLLVNAGLALAPEAFQIVLDSENEAKVASSKSKGQISYLCAKVEHHTRNVQKADGHVKRLGRENEKERIRLWSEIAKTARKQGVWDVCRAACRFCLLYDDSHMPKESKHTKRTRKKTSLVTMEDTIDHELRMQTESPFYIRLFSLNRDIMRTLAEVRFINAEATIQLLRMEGVRLNDPAVIPIDSQHSSGHSTHQQWCDAEWTTYSNWITQLSQYAMENFLRAAKIGEELNEAWIVHNAVVYVLNHNKHLIASKRQRELVDSLHILFNTIRNTGHCGDTAILIALCNALARGLIIPWIPKPLYKTEEKKVTEEGPIKRRRAGPKVPKEKPTSGPILSVDPGGIPDIRAAIEVCEFAMNLPDGNYPEEPVPIALRHEIIATWVKAKQLVQQQIASKHITEDENHDEGPGPLTKLFTGLEMYSCYGLGLMDFPLPNLHHLEKLTSECNWTDPLIHLQTLTRLTHFAQTIHDHELVMTCAQKTLELDEEELCNFEAKKKGISDYVLRNEMLSIASCAQGKSIMENLGGKKHNRLVAANSFVKSAWYAGEAGNIAIAMSAARHFWNACLPFIGSSADRQQIKKPTEILLKSLIKAAEAKNKLRGSQQLEMQRNPEERNNYMHDCLSTKDPELITSLHQWPTAEFQSSTSSDVNFYPGADEDLTLRTFLYVLLFQIYADKHDWEAGVKVLDEAIQLLPRTKHRLPIFKQLVIVKARLGRNYIMEIQKFKDESEIYLSRLWHRLAIVSTDLPGELACYQNTIEVLQKKESELKKVDNILRFAEWLYCNQFPLSDALKHLDWAIYILIHLIPIRRNHDEDDSSHPNTIEDFKSIKQLEALVRTHTLMAVISGHGLPSHQQHCLMAYAFVIRIWQVSLSSAGFVLKILAKTSPTLGASPSRHGKTSPKQKKTSPISSPKPSPKASPKRGRKDAKQGSPTSPTPKDRSKDRASKDKSPKNVKQVLSSSKEKPKRKGPIDALPANVEEWANYDCPDEIRDAFKQDPTICGLNKDNILAPTRTLYYLDLLVKELQKILCTHLTLPVLHLAEVIALNIVESKSLSDLYHLRLSCICLDLKLCQAAYYHEKVVGEVFINEMEQGSFRQQIIFKKENAIQDNKTESIIRDSLKSGDMDQSKKKLTAKDKILEINPMTGKGLSGISFPYLWMYKAEVLIQLCLYQPARHLLSEAHQAMQELNDPCAVSQCLYLLAVLANLEKNHRQSKVLIEKAQMIGGSEHFWHRSTMCLTDAILGRDKEEEDKMQQSCQFLQKTVNVLRQLIMENPNRESELHVIIASLEARKAYIQINYAQEFFSADHLSTELIEMLQESYDKLNYIEKDFLCYRCRNNSAEAVMARANIHRILGKHTAHVVDKQSHYLDAFRLAQEAVSQMEELFRHVNSLLPVNEFQTRNINTPLMRKLASMKFTLIQIILDIFVLVNAEKKRKEAGANNIEQIIEEFVRFTPDAASVEQAWITLGHTIGHNAQAQLTSIQSLYTGCPDIRAKYLYLTGRCLHLLADYMSPFPSDILWSESAAIKPCPEKSPSPETEKCEEIKVATNSVLLSKKQINEFKRKASELKRRQVWMQRYLFQSNEVLLQCINFALNNNLVDILASASLEMVENFGRIDPVSASQFLALYQSCTASIMMKNILLEVTRNTSSSHLAAMLHLKHHLEQKGDTTSYLVKNVEQRLTAVSKAWGNLYISPQHFNIMNELPPNFHILILQHSEDRSILYGALLEKVKLTNPKEHKEQKDKGGQQKEKKDKGGQQKEKGGQKGKPTQPTLQAKIMRSPVDSDTIMNLLDKIKVYKEEKADHLLDLASEKNESQNLQPSSTKLSINMEDEVEQYLSSQFQAILKDMEVYLRPVLSQFDFSELRPPSTAASPVDSGKTKSGDSGKSKKSSSPKAKAKANDSGKGKVAETGKSKTKHKDKNVTPQAGTEDIGECVILLADKLLLELPLEALNIFQEEAIVSLSRDFSLQLFYNRLHKEDPEIEVKRDVKSSKESRPKGDKKVKPVSLNRVLPPNCIAIDVNNVKYVVDPYNEVKEPESESPAQKFKAILDKYEAFALRWDGVIGSTHFPSQSEWEHLLKNCSVFLFYGLQRFLTHVILDRLVAMNIPDCQLMILSELVHSKPSHVRVANLDLHKSSLRLSLEMPTETAIILSLIGVRCIIANQWYSLAEENTRRLDCLCDNLLKVGKTTGQAIRILQRSKTPVEDFLKVDYDRMESPEDKKERHSLRSPSLRSPSLRSPSIRSPSIRSPSLRSPILTHSQRLTHSPVHQLSLNTVLYGLPNMMFV